MTVVALSLIHRGWKKGQVCKGSSDCSNLNLVKRHGISHVTGTRPAQRPGQASVLFFLTKNSDLLHAVGSVFNHILVNTLYTQYSILVLKLACLILYLLLLPFNPPKEPIKLYYVASLTDRGTLPYQCVHQLIVNMSHGQQPTYCIYRYP